MLAPSNDLKKKAIDQNVVSATKSSTNQKPFEGENLKESNKSAFDETKKADTIKRLNDRYSDQGGVPLDTSKTWEENKAALIKFADKDPGMSSEERAIIKQHLNSPEAKLEFLKEKLFDLVLGNKKKELDGDELTRANLKAKTWDEVSWDAARSKLLGFSQTTEKLSSPEKVELGKYLNSEDFKIDFETNRQSSSNQENNRLADFIKRFESLKLP